MTSQATTFGKALGPRPSAHANRRAMHAATVPVAIAPYFSYTLHAIYNHYNDSTYPVKNMQKLFLDRCRTRATASPRSADRAS